MDTCEQGEQVRLFIVPLLYISTCLSADSDRSIVTAIKAGPPATPTLIICWCWGWVNISQTDDMSIVLSWGGDCPNAPFSPGGGAGGISGGSECGNRISSANFLVVFIGGHRRQWLDDIFLSFFLLLHMPALRPASQAGPMRNPRDGISVVLGDTIRLA